MKLTKLERPADQTCLACRRFGNLWTPRPATVTGLTQANVRVGACDLHANLLKASSLKEVRHAA
jgi:hypothetical protein